MRISTFKGVFTEFKENLWQGLVDVVVVINKKRFKVKFKSGMEISVEI